MAAFEITADQLRTISDYLCDACDADFSEDDDLGVFRTYSGRGMYGRECIGITLGGISEIFALAMSMGEALRTADVDYDLIKVFKSPKSDSMGRDMILYWPSIAVINEDEDANA